MAPPPPWWSRMELKKTFEVFFGSKHASQKLLYCLHFSKYENG